MDFIFINSERKRKIVTPEQDPEKAPVLKRSKREPKPSKKLQEADLSSLGYSPKVVASIKVCSAACDFSSFQNIDTVSSIMQGCESICEKNSAPDNAEMPAKDVLFNALKVWKLGFVKSKKVWN